MPRKPDPTPIAPTDTLDAAALAAAGAAANVINAWQAQLLAHQDLYQIVGRLETVNFYETVSEKLLPSNQAANSPKGQPVYRAALLLFCAFKSNHLFSLIKLPA